MGDLITYRLKIRKRLAPALAGVVSLPSCDRQEAVPA